MATRAERCPTKRVYQSWDEAEKAAQLLIEDTWLGKMAIQKSGYILAYRCSECGLWHVGHQYRPHVPFLERLP